MVREDYDVPEFLSENAKDFIRKLLVPNQKDRLTLQQMKLHPWMTYESIHSQLKFGFFNNLRKDFLKLDDKIIKKIEKKIYSRTGSID